MLNTAVGIDTLHINPLEPNVGSKFRAIVTPSPYDSLDKFVTEEQLLFEVSGEENFGTGSQRHLKSCVLEFNPAYNRQTKEHRTSIKITMTIPKIVGPDNYYPADVTQLKQALAIVQQELAENGFHCDLNIALLKRLDVARTFEARDSWASYRPVLALLKPYGMACEVHATSYR